MPPKVKVTQEAILTASIEIVKHKGIGNLNARDIGKALGCSVQPIFSNFENMEQLKEVLYQRIETLFDEHMRMGMGKHQIPFLGMGLAYIDFAKSEQNLFKFLFMSDGFKGKSVLDMIRAEENREIVRIIAGMTGLDFERAEQLFLSIWLITHGIAALMATNDCDFSEETIVKLLTDAFSGMKTQFKN
jgi:AcrR family transcriptional regulator